MRKSNQKPDPMFSSTLDCSVSYFDAVRSSGEFFSVVMWKKETTHKSEKQLSDGEIVKLIKYIVSVIEFTCNEFIEDARIKSKNGDKSVLSQTNEIKEMIGEMAAKIRRSKYSMSLKKQIEIIEDLFEYFCEFANDLNLRFNILPRNKNLPKLLSSIR